MDKSLFRYIWKHSRRDQLVIFAVVFAQLPFYFWSLELPKRIVNEAISGNAFKNGKETARALDFGFTLPSFLGGSKIVLFEGFEFERVGFLFALSGLFLALVLVNGGFKYWINVAKGALGERMLRRMRFDLVSIALRFTPDTLRRVKPSETATMVKDEVEPIGGFIGDAFVQPLFLGTQALTAMTFIMVQNAWLGLIAGSIVAIQFAVIPRLRRVQIRLGRQRQLASRQLAGRVAEIVDGMEAVHVHNATRWERAEIGHRLHHLFDLRFRIYKWKFMVKFLNNLLAQITPFLFYAVGGYLALQGQLDIGQLVAVIAAYKDLPPPLKELIDWDQQRLDVQVKYEQVLEQFSPDTLIPLEIQDPKAVVDGPLPGPLAIEDLSIYDQHGPLIEGLSLAAGLPVHMALVGDGPAPSVLARALSRRVTGLTGRIAFGEADLLRMTDAAAGRHIAYAGTDPILFPGTVRDNLVYGLRRAPRPVKDMPVDRRRLMEAQRTGNPEDDPTLDWLDYEAVDATGPHDLDARLIEALELVGMRGDLYQLGLLGYIDAATPEEDIARFIEARRKLEARFEGMEKGRLLETFDPGRYTRQATIGENILFGAPRTGSASPAALAEDPLVREALDDTDLTDDLVSLGLKIAREMTEIFRDLPPGHPLFDQFSFIAADDIPDFTAMLRRIGMKGERALKAGERGRLIALTLGYVEPRHRLGLVDGAMEERLLQARTRFRELAGEDGPVAFHDPEALNLAVSLKDNLLFGRITHGVADAERKVMHEVMEVVAELDLKEAVERIGLGYRVGPSGRLLSAAQRIKVNLARCVVRRPDLLVVDGATTALGESEGMKVLKRIVEARPAASLVAVVRESATDTFDMVVRFDGTQATVEDRARGRERGVQEVAAQ